MSEPCRHPIGNWLNKACKVDGCRDLRHWFQLRTAEIEVTHERLRRWSSGNQIIPGEQAMLLVGMMGIRYEDVESALTSQLWIARLVSLAQEFLLAATPVTIDRDIVRAIIHQRLSMLGTEMLEASLRVSRQTISALFKGVDE